MGVSVSQHELNSTTLYPPCTKLIPFPSNLSAAPGDLVTYFMAKPPSYDLPSNTATENLFWWTAVEFVPFQDHTLFVSVGAYIQRPSASPLKASNLMQGLMYKWVFDEKRHQVELFRGSRTTAIPNITLHPSGQYICYIGLSTIHLMNFSTMESDTKSKSIRNNNFQHCAVSPNGYYIAYMSRTSRKIEIGLLLIEPSGYLKEVGYVYCDTFMRNFVSDGTYSDRYQCKFSQDSLYIAASTSYGHLIVVNRDDLSLHLSLSPGLVEWGSDSMTNERSFDFDPRFSHKRIVFGSKAKLVHFCDIDKKVIEKSIEIEDDGYVQCIKYAQRGHCLAVASSSGVIHILDPDEAVCIQRLDGTAVATEAVLEQVCGDLAAVIYMTFTSTGDILAVSYTDGYVRLWKVPTIIRLQELCKIAIYQSVHVRRLKNLPLPNRLIQELLNNYT